MLVIGLTGGIASGKSTVSAALIELGAVVVDADQVAREVVEPGKPAWRDIVDYFGPEVLGEGGELNRKALGAKVFGNREALDKLNSFTHPRVIETYEGVIEDYRQNHPETILVIDVPLLIEAGMVRLADVVWVVAVDEAEQINRLMERDKLTREDADKRLRSQMPLQEKLKYADRVIDSSGTLEDTRRRVQEAWAEVCILKK